MAKSLNQNEAKMPKNENMKKEVNQIQSTMTHNNTSSNSYTSNTSKTPVAGNSSNSSNHILWWVLGIVFVVLFVSGIIFVFFLIALVGVSSSSSSSSMGEGNIAHLSVSGVIVTEAQSSFFADDSLTSSADFVKLLQEVEEDDSIQGVIIEINSPGGSGVASDEIATQIMKLREKKPVVSYIRDVGASGSYWVASSTERIFANKFSTVGSIGVIGSYLEFSGMMDDYNVTYQRFVAGKNKDFGSPFRQPTEEQRKAYQAILDELHGYFIEAVAQGRNMPVDSVKKYADGSIFSGVTAKKIGLVDEIGGLNEAVEYMEEKIGESVSLIEYNKEPSLFDLLTASASQNAYQVGKGIGESIQPDMQTVQTFRT